MDKAQLQKISSTHFEKQGIVCVSIDILEKINSVLNL